MKLLIAIPTHEYMHADFVRSLLGLAARLQRDGVRYDIVIESGTLVHMARDKLAAKAVKGFYTHVLWLDADMVFDDDILENLMFSGKSFVSGIAHSRRPSYGSCLFKNIELDTLERWKAEDYPKAAFEIAGCGMACVLMKTEILKQVFLANGTCFLPVLHYGEDLAFCRRVHSLGVKMYAEPTARLGHMGFKCVYPEDEKRWETTISNFDEVSK